MLHSVSAFIGLRYLRGGSDDKFSRFVSYMSTAGITIGVMSLVTVLSVMNGFEAQLKNQYKIELAHVTRLRKHIRACFDKGDHGSKEILDKILEETEDSVDWLETQFNRIKDIGIKNYMMENMSKDNN